MITPDFFLQYLHWENLNSYILLLACMFEAKRIIGGLQAGLETTDVRFLRAMLSPVSHPKRQRESAPQGISQIDITAQQRCSTLLIPGITPHTHTFQRRGEWQAIVTATLSICLYVCYYGLRQHLWKENGCFWTAPRATIWTQHFILDICHSKDLRNWDKCPFNNLHDLPSPSDNSWHLNKALLIPHQQQEMRGQNQSKRVVQEVTLLLLPCQCAIPATTADYQHCPFKGMLGQRKPLSPCLLPNWSSITQV